MIIADTSGSMNNCTNPVVNTGTPDDTCPFVDNDSNGVRDNLNSCGMEPTRVNDAKCALRQTVQAFAGAVNFGLSTYAVRLGGCNAVACTDSCTGTGSGCNPPDALGTEGEFYSGAGCSVSVFADAPGSGLDETCGNQPNCSSGAGPTGTFGEDWENGGSIVVPLLQEYQHGDRPRRRRTFPNS